MESEHGDGGGARGMDRSEERQAVTGTARLLELLSDGKPHTARECYALGVMVHSRVADLRKRGHVIRCESIPGKTGADGYQYRLEPLEGAATTPAAPSSGLVADASLLGARPLENAAPAQERPMGIPQQGSNESPGKETARPCLSHVSPEVSRRDKASIMGEDWIEPDSLKAKTTIMRLLGWDNDPPASQQVIP